MFGYNRMGRHNDGGFTRRHSGRSSEQSSVNDGHVHGSSDETSHLLGTQIQTQTHMYSEQGPGHFRVHVQDQEFNLNITTRDTYTSANNENNSTSNHSGGGDHGGLNNDGESSDSMSLHEVLDANADARGSANDENRGNAGGDGDTAAFGNGNGNGNGNINNDDATAAATATATNIEEEMADQITTMTNRLRLLFYTLYIPVIPLLTLLVFLLADLISKASKSINCTQPLRSYSYFSLVLFIYLPNHKRIRRWLFNYNRENHHTRPRAIRMYDQCFHMLVIFYIYFDMSLVQSCKDSLDPNPALAGSEQSICMTKCPELYASFLRFDLILRIFAGVLVLPMICLPFAYLWLIRRITAVDTDALVRLGVQLSSERDNLAGGAKTKEVLQGLREVKLERCKDDLGPEENGEKVRVVGVNEQSWSGDKLKDWRAVKDCCICMCEFECNGIMHRSDDESDVTAVTQNDDVIVETKCGHLFHRNCIGSWVGGNRWEEADANSRARRKNCPLCREDLMVNGMDAV